MNIFATSANPVEAAQWLDDKRVGSQLREAAQLLSSCSLYDGIKAYKPFNVNHPAQQWVNARQSNLEWLIRHFLALAQEWEHRYGYRHGSDIAMRDIHLIHATPELPDTFYNGCRRQSLDLDFTHMKDVHAAYRKYLNARWPLDAREPLWTKRSPPPWAKFTWLKPDDRAAT